MKLQRCCSQALFLLTLRRYSPVAAKGYSFIPRSRSPHPVSIYQTAGDVTSAEVGEDLQQSRSFTLTGANASVTYDFGQLVAGQPSIHLEAATCHGRACNGYGLPAFNCTGECEGLRLGYTESPLFVDKWGGTDWTSWYTFPDGPLYLPLDQLGSYTVPERWARGSFRYLTLSLGPDTSSATSVRFSFSSLEYTAAPQLDLESSYTQTGYFDSSDDLLNRIWAAGVYTVQMNTMAANTSLNISYFLDGGGWADDATSTSLSGQDVFIADGAKRNRNPWSADFSIFFRTALVSQNYDDLRVARNGIQANFVLQDQNALSTTYGYFSYAGSPLGDAFFSIGDQLGFPLYSSDTYQCWAILSFLEYFETIGDYDWASKYWPQIILGVNATFSFINPPTGLFNGTRTVDWGRDGQGGENIALNAVYYYTLVTAARLAPKLSSPSGVDIDRWMQTANRVKQAANLLLWDKDAGLYRDNTTSAGSEVYPQDGNSFAIRFNLTSTPAQSLRIVENLSSRWTPYGAPSAELRGYISPFATSHELLAQFAARPGQPGPALDLMRTQWGYMLHAFSNETCVEGYGADGSLAYGFYGDAPAFISLAHALSTGPTYALTSYVAGIRAVRGLDVNDSNGDWVWMPGVEGANVSWVRGGFTAPHDRKFDVEWRVDEHELSFLGAITAPIGERGTVYVPLMVGTVAAALDKRGAHSTWMGSKVRLLVNGTMVRGVQVDESGRYVRLKAVPGGRTRVSLRYDE